MTFVLKWLTFSCVGYLYLRFLTHTHTNYELGFALRSTSMGHRESSVTVNPDKDNYQEYFDKIVLTEAEEAKLIREYSRMERLIKVNSTECAIGVGYTTCMDINFRAVDMFQALQPQFQALIKQQGGHLIPQVHDQISDLREFTETFLYYFSKGVNAERVSDSEDIFSLFIQQLKESKTVVHKDELGGHSSVFAQRSQKEGCNVFIAAQGSEFNKNSIPIEGLSDNLIWPTKTQSDKALDVHLVFEYNEGDTILGYRAPRSNRFYFVTDPNGASFKQMELYHEHLKANPQIKRHMFGGYQLMQKLPLSEAEQRLQKLEKYWKELKSKGHMIHVEFAHFSNLDIFRIFEKYAVTHADSLGMNEQELILLLDFWEGKLDDILSARDSQPTLNDIIDQLARFFKLAKSGKSSVSRVHTHPYGSFILCYDTSKWEDGRDAIIKSALTTPKYCMMTEDLSEHIENYDIPERPTHFTSPMGEVIKIEKENLTYDFNLLSDVKCHLQFFMKCRKMIKTAGMGDTISSTGFIYHQPKNQ